MPGVFPAATTSEMIETITKLLADPQRANKVGDDGRAVVEQTMTWQPSYAKIAAVLEQVLHS
jgi:glycosyltransferase involved in cell wall biosynthesis